MALIPLQDLSDRRLRPFSGMADGQLRRGEGFRRDCPEGLFVAESAKVIERALDAGLEPLSVLADSHWIRHDAAVIERILALWPEAPVFQATPEQFRDLTGYQVVRGALACFQRPSARNPRELLAGARRVAVLEDVTNYANMGAMFRSAAALGMDAVLVSPSCHDPLYRRCARVSMGAVLQVPWARLEQPLAEGGADLLHGAGFQLAALALRPGSLGLRDPRLRACERLALVLGSEGEGLAPATIDSCDMVVHIPMAHGVDSLNVAACAAIAFWELGGC